MNKEKFFELICSLQPTMSKQDTVLRESIKADERVAVTLRYLATGKTFSSLETQFWINRTTISEIVLEVCDNIFAVLAPGYLKVPSTTSEWLPISDVDMNGRMSDGENWSRNKFREMIASEDNPLQIPSPKPLATFSKSHSGNGNSHWN